MMIVPMICSMTAIMTSRNAERILPEDAHEVGGEQEQDARERRRQADSTQALIRPCAEMTRIWRFSLKRSRITLARLSSTSDRLPPDSRCVSTAVTKNRASRTGTRCAIARMASGSDMPKFCSS